MEAKNKTDLVRLSGLWELTDKSGKKYFSFKIDGKQYLIFTNNYRKSENQPSHVLFEVMDKEKAPEGA